MLTDLEFNFSCMSQKAALPSLTGHRTKTRKRDEKKVNDPTGFRDSVIEGLSNTGSDGSDITETEVSQHNTENCLSFLFN